MAAMTANAEIMLEERKGILGCAEGAIVYKKDHSTEVEIPDATVEGGKRRVPVNHGISTDRRCRS